MTFPPTGTTSPPTGTTSPPAGTTSPPAGKRSERSTGDRDCDVDPRGAGESYDHGPDAQVGYVRPPGWLIADAAKQGVVTRADLLAEGVSRHVIDRRARQGDLHRRHRGVYLVGHDALAPLAAEHAALLACGERAVISHASAAYVWGVVDEPPKLVHLTLVGYRRRPKRGVRMHAVDQIDRRDVTRTAGLLITAPARTLIDFAVDAGEQELAAAVAEARVRKLVSTAMLERALDRSRRRPGAGRLRALLRAEREPAVTRSEGERRLRKLVLAARLPTPEFNVRVAGYLVDALWRDRRLVLEVDGFQFHAHRAAFERDRARDAVLVAAGYRVIRVTWRHLVDKPIAVAAAIAGALALAP